MSSKPALPQENHDPPEPSSPPESTLSKPKDNRSTIDLSAHSIDRNIWILAIPLIAERLLRSIVDAADMAMVGRAGAAAVAAVGMSNQLSMIADSFFDAIRVGTTTVVARRMGEGRVEDAQKTLTQSIYIAAAVGLLSIVIISTFARPMLEFMGADSDVIREGVPYFLWKGISLLFMFVAMTFHAALRGAGEARLPLYSEIVVNALNLIGNYLLIGGKFGFPKMGTAGAGLSTAFARFVGMVAIIILTGRKDNVLGGWAKHSRKPEKETLTPVLNIGLPASAERLTFRSAQVFFTKAITGLGTAAYAAHQVAMRTESLALVIGFAFGGTATTLVGQYLGFGDVESAERASKRCKLLSSFFMGIAGVVIFLAARPLVSLFVPHDAEVTNLGGSVLKVIAFAQPFMAMNHALAGSLRGAGDTKWVMYIQSGSAWALRVSLTYLLAGTHGLHGAWYAMVADQITRAVLFQLRFNTGHWKKIKV